MKHTKKILSVLLAIAVSFSFFAAVPNINFAAALTQKEVDAKVAALDEQIEKYEEQIKKNNEKKSEAKETADDIQAEIDVYQRKINAVQSKINVLDSQITSMNSKINRLEKTINELQASIQQQEDTISETQSKMAARMRAIYLSGNVSNLELILEANNFKQLINRLELIARLARNDHDLISTLQVQVDKVKQQEHELAKEEAEVQTSKQIIEQSKSEQEAAKAEIVKDKSVVDAKKKTLDNYIDGLDEDNAELRRNVAEARQQQQAFMNSLNAQVSAQGSRGSGKANGTMVWPVPYGDSYISSGYGNRTVNGYSSFHYGIDITRGGADQWTTAVVAADSGTIIIASNACSHNYRKSSSCGCNGGYGNYVVIDNGNGLHIYNAHLYRATVSVGQHVSAGQQIGILGCTGYSTGPHLHFEIRVNDGSSRSAAARNPLNYVSH